jgi:lysophospholipase L1-like esterase
MEKEIGQDRPGRASDVSGVVRGSSVRAPHFAATAVLLLAASMGACSDDSNPSMTQNQSENPAPGPTTPSTTPAATNPTPSTGQGSTEPSNSTPSSNEGSGGDIPLQPEAMEGQSGGTPPSNTTPPAETEGNGSETTPPAEEMPPAEETPPAQPEQPTAFNPCPTDGSACRIMPLGDSITFGIGSGNGTGNGGGYRLPLFRQAVQDGHEITFVGRQTNGSGNVNGQAFPANNEGYSGATISTGGNQLANRVDAAISANPPDIILLHIGTNNLYNGMGQEVPGQLEALIDQITDDAPDALVVVAQLTPMAESGAQFTFPGNGVNQYNALIPDIVQERVDAGKHLLLVDMNTAFKSANMNFVSLLAEGLHPNDMGYTVMAQTWYAAIESLLP